MKVAVDARLLSRPLTGIGRYTFEMCRALLKLESIALYLYSPAAIKDEVRQEFSSAHLREMNWNNGLLRQLWSESYLPLWAKLDEVDVFWGPAHRLPRLLPKGMSRVVTIHDLVWKYAGETMSPATYVLEKIQMPLAARSADMIVADSYSTASAVKLEFCVEEGRLAVVPLAANCDQDLISFGMLEELGIQQPYFLFVGTLEPRKNLASLLAAYACLPKSVKAEAMLVIAGGKGWGKVDLGDMIAKLDLGEYVNVLGYVNESMLATLYAHAKFLAMPSIYEGFGLPLLEAMVYGVPVLAANNSSMPEVTGDAGLLVDAQSIDSIANGLKQMITDKERRNKLAANTKLNAARFSWDKSAQQLFTVFEKAISVRNLVQS